MTEPAPADTADPQDAILWVSTTQDQPWSRQSPPRQIDLTVETMTSIPSLFVGADQPQQMVEGFGGSFNEMGWDALSLLTDDDRAAVMKELFQADGDGLRLNLCRLPLGANDFARDWYSYDEVEGDYELEHFSVEHDLETIVPFVRAAQELTPDLKLWSSPWSPPSWMKNNGHYAAAKSFTALGGVDNGLRDDQVRHSGTDMLRLDEAVLATYAEYFGRYIDSYRELGIEIGMVMPQNEFNAAQPFPSCTWTPQGLAAFIAHLGPVMAARGVEVFLGTMESPDDSLVEDILADESARPYIAGLGVQWHGKTALPFIHRAHPDLRIYQTEQECGDARNDWRHARHAWNLMRTYFANGVTGYDYWNMALPEGGVSRWGWAQNSLVVVDPESKSYRFTHELYVLKHVSRFVARGAHVIPAVSYVGFENQIAFRNPDGSVVLVMHNDLASEQPVDVLVGGRLISPVLPADSFNTFVIPA